MRNHHQTKSVTRKCIIDLLYIFIWHFTSRTFHILTRKLKIKYSFMILSLFLHYRSALTIQMIMLIVFIPSPRPDDAPVIKTTFPRISFGFFLVRKMNRMHTRPNKNSNKPLKNWQLRIIFYLSICQQKTYIVVYTL